MGDKRRYLWLVMKIVFALNICGCASNYSAPISTTRDTNNSPSANTLQPNAGDRIGIPTDNSVPTDDLAQ